MEFTSYGQLYEKVVHGGQRVKSRYGDTLELRGVQFVTRPGLIPHRKGINRALGYMELCQLIAGVFDPDAIRRVAPNADHALFTPEMAYGPRVRDQVPALLTALDNDPETRQGVLLVENLKDGPSERLPCTVAVHVICRNMVLECHVYMRSWDIVKGLPYDLTMFGGLQIVAARHLGLKPGELRVTATSAHAYVIDVEAGKVPTGLATPFWFVPECPTFWYATKVLAVEAIVGQKPWAGRVPPFLKEGPYVNGH